MKKYIIRAIEFMVGFTVICLLLDLVTGEMLSSREYIIHAVIVGVLVGLGSYLDDKGWNSWKKIGGLFKRKKADG